MVQSLFGLGYGLFSLGFFGQFCMESVQPTRVNPLGLLLRTI